MSETNPLQHKEPDGVKAPANAAFVLWIMVVLWSHDNLQLIMTSQLLLILFCINVNFQEWTKHRRL